MQDKELLACLCKYLPVIASLVYTPPLRGVNRFGQPAKQGEAGMDWLG